jgi:hypothetical protein
MICPSKLNMGYVLREFKNFGYLLVGMYGVQKQTIQPEYFGHLQNLVKCLISDSSENDSSDDVQK